MEKKKFAAEDVLSVTTGLLVTERGMEAVYEVLGFMEGRPVWTHELPGLAAKHKPTILDQFPALRHVDVLDYDKKDWKSWARREIKALKTDSITLYRIKKWGW